MSSDPQVAPMSADRERDALVEEMWTAFHKHAENDEPEAAMSAALAVVERRFAGSGTVTGKPANWSDDRWDGWRRARSMMNRSGCCCVFGDDDETIISQCAAHAAREAEIRVDEREACAKVALQGHCTASGCDPQTIGHSNLCPIGIAAAIRARSTLTVFADEE